MDTHPNRYVYAVVLSIGILSVSTASIFIRFAQEDAPSLAIAALRLLFASLALAPIALKYHKSELFAISRRELVFGLFSGLFLAIHFATWISSLEYTSVASSVLFVSTGPIWVAMFSPVFLKEKLSPRAFFGLGLTIAGGSLVALSGACVWEHGVSCPNLSTLLHGRAMWGNLLALSGALAVAGYLMIGRRLRGNISIIPYIFLVYSIAALVLIAIMVIARESPFGFQPKTYLWLLLLAFIPQLVGHSIYNWSLRFLPAAMVSITTLGEPIGSSILAYIILQEKPGPAILIGGLLILTGIYFAARATINNKDL